MDEDSTAQIPDEQSAPEPKGSRAADFSLLLGILSNFCFWFVAGIPALILGIIAIRNINRNPTAITGRAKANTGIVLSCTGMIVFPFLFFIVGDWVSHPSHGVSDGSVCRRQMSTNEKIIITHGYINEIESGKPIPVEVIVDEEYLSNLSSCPSGGIYTYTGKMPSGDAGSTPYTRCSFKGHYFVPY